MIRTFVTLVRHGETEWNVAKRLQGNRDSNLTDNGIQQAHSVAKALCNNTFDAIITSDLGRAVKTAEIINEFHHLKLKTELCLRERAFGIMEGLTREEILDDYPEVFHAYMERKDSYHIPQGESLIEFHTRVTEGLHKIISAYEEKKILIVSHGGVLDCIMRMIFDYPLSSPRRFSIYNAAINTFSVTGRDWFLEQWGNIDHQNVQSISLDELKE